MTLTINIDSLYEIFKMLPNQKNNIFKKLSLSRNFVMKSIQLRNKIINSQTNTYSWTSEEKKEKKWLEDQSCSYTSTPPPPILHSCMSYACVYKQQAHHQVLVKEKSITFISPFLSINTQRHLVPKTITIKKVLQYQSVSKACVFSVHSFQGLIKFTVLR